jgi:hypothetical protein
MTVAQENRGFEGLAITPDGSLVYAMLQVGTEIPSLVLHAEFRGDCSYS